MILADPTKQNLTPNMIFGDHTNQNLTPNIKFADHTNWNYKQHKSSLFNLFCKHQHRIWNTTSWNIWKPAPYMHIIGDKCMPMTPWCWAKALHQWHRYARASCSIRARAVNYAAYQPSCSSWLPLMHKCTLWAMFWKYWAREDYIFVTEAKWHAAKCPWHRNAQAGCSIREGKLSIMLLITHPAHPAPLWLPSAGHRLQWALTEHTKIRTSF